MQEVRTRTRSLQARLDEEGDTRERVARFHTVIDINSRAGGGEGLMQLLGYSAGNKGRAETISRIRMNQQTRTSAAEMGGDPLDAAKERTEKLQTRLVGEESARDQEFQATALNNMETARLAIQQKSAAADKARASEQMSRRKKQEAYFNAIETAGKDTRTGLSDAERLTAANEARIRREAALVVLENQNAETDVQKSERAQRKALAADALMAKLDANIEKLEGDLKGAQGQLEKAGQPVLKPAPGSTTISVLHDTMVAGESSSSYWAGRVEDLTLQLEWMKRQAIRRAAQL